MVTPTCGVLAWAAAATCFARNARRELLLYLAASTLAPAGIVLLLLSQSGLVAAFADSIAFTGAHYASIQGVPFGFGINIQTYPIVFLFPISALLAVIVCIVERHNILQDHKIFVCIAFALAGFVGCFPRPDVGRIAFAAPLLLPLAGYCLVSLAQHCRLIYSAAASALLTIGCLPSALAFWVIAENVRLAPVTETPRGRISLVAPRDAAGMLTQIAAIPARDPIFFYPYMPLMSFLTGREQVSKYDLFTPDYTLPAQYQSACLAIMHRAAWVVIDRQWTNPAFLKASWPALQNPTPPETEAFERALNKGFDLVSTSGTFELRRRNASASPALCTGIVN